MRVLFILNAFSPGGAEIHIWQLANALATKGWSSKICALRELGVPLVPKWNAVPIQTIGGNQLYDIAALRALSQAIRDFRPDVIVPVNLRPLYFASVARRFAGSNAAIACVVQSAIEHIAHHRQQLLRHLYRPFVARADTMVYVSHNQKTSWEADGYKSRNATVIHNGVDIARFSPAGANKLRNATRASLGLDPGDYVLGMSAEFRTEKNHRQLVDAVKALREDGIPANALFVGDGATAAENKAYAQASGVGDNIIFAGHQEDVLPFVACFDVGVLCSVAETFSLAALEIMATGRPLVITDVAGAREMVRPGENGFLFTPGDTAALVEHSRILFDPAIRAKMGDEAASFAAENFDHDRMIEVYADLFESRANRRAEPA